MNAEEHVLSQMNEEDFDEFLFGDVDPDEPICPECLTPTDFEELDVFGGLCEECSTDW